MIYIEDTDLKSVIQSRFIDNDFADLAASSDIIDDVEAKAIDYAKSYISTRYDVAKIFDETTPLRNGILLQIIAQIVIYRAVRRNAARKVPDDFVNLMTEATTMLSKIQGGAMVLVGLPLLTDEDGNETPLMWGNNENELNYI